MKINKSRTFFFVIHGEAGEQACYITLIQLFASGFIFQQRRLGIFGNQIPC